VIDAIRARLARRWALAKDEASWCGLVITVDDQSAMVVVKPINATRVIIAAQVCPLRALEASAALQYNAFAPRGALAIEQGTMYVLREVVTIDDSMEDVIEELAREAVRLRTNADGAMKSAQALSHYAD